MGKTNRSKGKASHRINPLPLIAVAAVIICAIAVFAVKGSQTGTGESVADTAAESPGSGGGTVVEPGGTFSIPLSEVTADAGFFKVEVDGTVMEIIAVRDSQGNIRTAFNTCQTCYGSGRAYYVQSGDYLVCQNCGSRFSMDQVEVQANGCNPWPIFPEDKTVTDEEILLSYDFLSTSKELFANWKVSY